MPEPLQFTIRQTPSGVWIKEREDGRRGLCVADEAVLWQALRAAEDRAGPGGVDVAALIAENERLHLDCGQLVAEKDNLHATCERLSDECEALRVTCERLREERETLRANQRRRPGRPRKDAIAQAPLGPLEALAAPEQDPLDEDL